MKLPIGDDIEDWPGHGQQQQQDGGRDDNYININIKDPDVGALAFHLIVLQDARVLHAKGIEEQSF